MWINAGWWQGLSFEKCLITCEVCKYWVWLFSSPAFGFVRLMVRQVKALCYVLLGLITSFAGYASVCLYWCRVVFFWVLVISLQVMGGFGQGSGLRCLWLWLLLRLNWVVFMTYGLGLRYVIFSWNSEACVCIFFLLSLFYCLVLASVYCGEAELVSFVYFSPWTVLTCYAELSFGLYLFLFLSYCLPAVFAWTLAYACFISFFFLS